MAGVSHLCKAPAQEMIWLVKREKMRTYMCKLGHSINSGFKSSEELTKGKFKLIRTAAVLEYFIANIPVGSLRVTPTEASEPGGYP